MKVLRVTLSALFVFALLHAGCSGKQANRNAFESPTPDGAAQQDAPQQSPTGGSDDARALFERGKDAYKHNRDEEAVEDFKQATQLDPDFAEAHYRLGLAYNVTKQKDEADKSFEQAVKLYEKLTKQDPKNSDAYYFLGLCYEQLGKYDDAARVLKEAVKNSPTESDDKYFELALSHYKLAQYDESVRALNKALEINPDNFPAQELLEQARSGAARIEEFRKHQEQLRKQQNSNANTRNSNSGANTNSGAGTGTNRNTAAAPPT
jgi:tetratricopeptide (TPR) repeat protein